VKPNFNQQKQVKISANREKKQVYLHFSEVKPNFNQQKQVKISANRDKSQVDLLYSLTQVSFIAQQLVLTVNGNHPNSDCHYDFQRQ
jgi:hypothetical protein